MIGFDDEMRSMEQVEAAIEVATKYQFETLSLSFSYQFDFSIPDSIGDITSLKKLEIWSRYCNAHCLQDLKG